ncbi:metal ABC transporter ATP-binding protein [Pseudodesulfovibrio tunisiensis]|uniref:metal ABC transporter ATP-binding protein n=1 Tax=Pseudodesulfovibrio tunisiensis TaxID=463192 RepID=UPI001FB325D9|nr:metal ABC transporter ATP-binding protein [Pseudodesulfovibrio tunisiensis]
MSDTIIAMRDVCFAYNGPRVLDNVTLTVRRGDFMAMLGPNGGGKSTLLKLMLGLIRPDSGSVRILDRAPGDAGGSIGYLPQHTHVSKAFPISVMDAVRLGMIRPGLGGIMGLGSPKRDSGKAREALERVGLAGFETRRLADLSGGQQQRVFIARALVSRPELLLLDEPTASVDPASRNELFTLLGELNNDMTIVMVSHDISALATCVKSVACVNRSVHFHERPEITGDMFRMAYGARDGLSCPVELIAHGTVPHRVLEEHDREEAE